jgi:hypothetical protein
MKRYPRKLAYNDYVKFYKDENYMPFSTTKFGLKLKSVVYIHKTTQNNNTVRYYMIKDYVKTRYNTEDEEMIDILAFLSKFSSSNCDISNGLLVRNSLADIISI